MVKRLVALLLLLSPLAQGDNRTRLHNAFEEVLQEHKSHYRDVREGAPRWFDRLAQPGHNLKLLKTGPEDFAERYRLVRSAKKSIYISAFAFTDDHVTQELLRILCDKAENQNVDVRIIADSYGSNFGRENPGTRIAESFRSCGIPVIFFASIDWGVRAVPYSMHEKMLLVDGVSGIFGGMSFGRGYERSGRQSNRWHDLDILAEGPVVCQLQKRYEEIWWKSVKKDRGGSNPQPLIDYGHPFDPCTPVVMGPSRAAGQLWNPYFEKKGSPRPLNASYFQAILSSKKIIRMYAPYFIPHEDMIVLLQAARSREVEVQIISNSPDSSDESDYANVAMMYRVQPLLEAGARLFLWKTNATMHRKAAVFDNKWAYVGSDNFDRRGQEFNSESAIYTDDQDLIRELAYEFDLDRDTMTHEYFLEDVKKELAKKSRFLKWYSKKLIPIL